MITKSKEPSNQIEQPSQSEVKSEEPSQSRYTGLQKILIALTVGFAAIFIELYRWCKRRIENNIINAKKSSVEPVTDIEKALDAALYPKFYKLNFYNFEYIIDREIAIKNVKSEDLSGLRRDDYECNFQRDFKNIIQNEGIQRAEPSEIYDFIRSLNNPESYFCKNETKLLSIDEAKVFLVKAFDKLSKVTDTPEDVKEIAQKFVEENRDPSANLDSHQTTINTSEFGDHCK